MGEVGCAQCCQPDVGAADLCAMLFLQMANNLEGGKTPQLPPAELQRLGFKLVAYPLAARRFAAGHAGRSGWDCGRPSAARERDAVVPGEFAAS